MDTFQIILISAASVYGLAILIAAAKTGHFFKTLLFSALLGIAALIIINVTASLSGVLIPINQWTVSVSAAVGIPGVVSMLLLRLIFLGF